MELVKKMDYYNYEYVNFRFGKKDHPHVLIFSNQHMKLNFIQNTFLIFFMYVFRLKIKQQ